MRKRPLSITIISWLFIALGSIGLVAGLLPHGGITAAQRLAELETHWYVHVSRFAGILSGVLMLYGLNWGRWLLVAWLAFHVVVGYLHSPVQLLTHSLFLVLGLYFLFRKPAAAYFRSTKSS